MDDDTPDQDPDALFEFRCKTCGLPLTDPLRLLPEEADFGDVDGEPLIPQGFYSWDDGCVVINVRDRQNVRRVKNEDRLDGCCGPSGMDGPNTECFNGHEVATEVSDCWLPHALTFKADAVTQHPAPAEAPAPPPVKRWQRESKPIPWRPPNA